MTKGPPLLLDIKKVGAVFGKSTEIYANIVNDIAPDLVRDRYTFEDIADFNRKSHDVDLGRMYMGHVYWKEILYRAHMASVAAVFRSSRWIEVAVREHEAGSLYGCASACRALIESAGDINHSLGPVALTLAEAKFKIRQEISGSMSSQILEGKELEDTLIHFTHARKVAKSESAPDSHKAMPTYQYVDYLEQMKIPGVKTLYARLCEIVHPAADSVSMLFTVNEGAYRADPGNERSVLDRMLVDQERTLSGIVMASFNAPLLVLRALHGFDLFAKLPGLRKYRLDDIPQWKTIQSAMRS